MRITAVFSDGASITASTYEELEARIKDDEWNPSDHTKYRIEMTNRALNIGGWHLNKDASAKMFVKGLEKSGVIARLEVEGEVA